MKVLPLLSKQLDLCVSRMTTSNGGPVTPVPSKRRKNSVFSYYFSVKYIDTQINCLFSCLFLFSLVFCFLKKSSVISSSHNVEKSSSVSPALHFYCPRGATLQSFIWGGSSPRSNPLPNRFPYNSKMVPF